MIEITESPISIERVIESVRDSGCGAVVVFIGTVRDMTDDKKVLYLQYDAYRQMAEKLLSKLSEDAKQRFGVKHISITHRIGKVYPGEVSVVIAVSSPHRKEAYEASRYLIESLKKEAPIWKKEFRGEGEEWISGG